MMIGQFDNQHDWHIAAQMGVANYGQMTAGGWMYIGPQGIVHGTFNTLLNAGRLKLGIPQDQDLRGHLFISSGLGGMSGAQPKAAEIAGAVSIIAEVDRSRIETRYRQGWVGHVTADIIEAYRMATEAMRRREPCSIAYHGNIVDLLEYAEREKDFDRTIIRSNLLSRRLRRRILPSRTDFRGTHTPSSRIAGAIPSLGRHISAPSFRSHQEIGSPRNLFL